VSRAFARAAVAWGKPIVVKRFALVSRWNDVQHVLEQDLAYRIEPINGPNFQTISGAFVLGLDRGPQFARERRQMYDAVSRIDTADLRARIRGEADRIIADALDAGDRIDVAHGYAHPVAARSAAYSSAFPADRGTPACVPGAVSLQLSRTQRARVWARAPCRRRTACLDGG
jgi:cytochrome P450